MNKFILSIAFIASLLFSVNVLAQAVVYDPMANSQFMTIIAQAKEMYQNAKAQLDGMVAIEKTIKEASEAYETLSKFDLNNAIDSMKKGEGINSFSALRSSIAGTEGKFTGNKNLVEGNIYRLAQLESLELVRSAAVKNGQQTAGKINQLTAAQISAQNSSLLLALKATEEQNRLKEIDDKVKADQKDIDNVTRNSSAIYNAIGSNGKTK